MRRSLFEAIAWIAAVSFLWTVDTFAKLTYRDNTGIGKGDYKLITDQVTSATAALTMILFVVYWLRLFPIKKTVWVPAIIGHVVGSVIFAFGHYSLMVLFRIVIHDFNNTNFVWVYDFIPNLIVEYQKDIKIYVAIVLIISAYQYYRSTHKPAAAPGMGSQKLVVQTGSGESVVRFEDIDYLESSRNYVVVHVEAKEFLVRDTISRLEARLAGEMFARTHRSFIVNVEKIREIRPTDSGHRVFLRNGAELPLSRSYRESLKSCMAS
jgi:hypothetical protein